MTDPQKRLARERKTIQTMINLYCRGHHDTNQALCDECATLSAYAMERIDKCPFQDDKPTCAKCPIHCYKPDMRARVRAVMRYAGPRMMLHHPVLTFWHYYDEFSKKRMDKQSAVQRVKMKNNSSVEVAAAECQKQD
jgi:hypothetical protein